MRKRLATSGFDNSPTSRRRSARGYCSDFPSSAEVISKRKPMNQDMCLFPFNEKVPSRFVKTRLIIEKKRPETLPSFNPEPAATAQNATHRRRRWLRVKR